jgi:hypothetical protein
VEPSDILQAKNAFENLWIIRRTEGQYFFFILLNLLLFEVFYAEIQRHNAISLPESFLMLPLHFKTQKWRSFVWHTQKPVVCHCGDRCRDSHVPRIVLSALCLISARYQRITPPEVTTVRWQMLWLRTTWGNPFVLLVKPVKKHGIQTNLRQRTTPRHSSKRYIWSSVSV